MKYLIIILLFLSSNTALAEIPADKRDHFIASIIISNALSKTELKPEEVLGICISIGILKEVADYFRHGQPELGDIVADTLGCASGMVQITFDDGYINPKYCKLGVYKGILFEKRSSCIACKKQGTC
ncbi:MAG: hypothetical protein COA63_014300 [Methylophaga sp.]|nr:hypothetical protein [Methylophaga sp.]